MTGYSWLSLAASTKKLEQMHFTKPCEGIHTVVVKILNVLLEIRNLLDNL